MSNAPQLAIHGGPKTVTKTFPWPIVEESDIRAVSDVLKSGRWGDPDCTGLAAAFEREFASYCGTRFAISSVNGSVAIRLALIASGVKDRSVVRLTKSSTDSPDEKRAVRAVGSTWLGPAM